MFTRRLSPHLIAVAVFLGFLGSSSTAGASDWIQIGKGVFSTDLGNAHGKHHQSGRLAQVSLVPGACGLLGCTDYVLWAGASHGGLWVYNQYVGQWFPVTDNLSPHTLGSFAVMPSLSQLNIVIGTGAFVWGKGDGIHYTTNAGESWHAANQPSTPARVTRIVSDGSLYSEFLLAATSDGIWHSNDFGQNWVSRLSGVEATDIVQDVYDSTRWYAGVVNRGIYRSTDSGKTWQPYGTGIKGSTARISLASCPFHKDILYALVVKNDNKLNGVYRSSDRGSSWTKIYWDDAVINPDEQGLHTCAIACNPFDPDNVVFGLAKVASVANAKADPPVTANVFDGGHDDYNFFLFQPFQPYGLLIANDGGFYFSSGGLDDTENLHGLNNLELGQPKTVKGSTLQGGLASSYSNPDVFVAGLQDNGVVRGNVANDPAINLVFESDGRHVSIMPAALDADVLGFAANGSNIRHLSYDGGMTATGIDLGLTPEKSCPVLIDPTPGLAKPHVFTAEFDIFGPGNIVFYNDVFSPAPSWKAVSTELIPSLNVTSNVDSVVDPGLREIVATVAGDTHVYAYIGRRDQLGSLPLSDISPPIPGSPTHPDARINADRSAVQPQTLYYTSGEGHYNVGGQQVRLAYVSRDGGAHWTDVTGDIATVSGNANLLKLIGNPGNQAQFFLATSKGVFRSDDLGIHWTDYSKGLRFHEQVDDIVINFDNVSGNPTLYVATHGRGFWRRTID